MALSAHEISALKEFKAKLEQAFGSQFIEMKLFGSKARGDDRADSDVDVLLILVIDDLSACDTVYGIATDILLESEVCISPKVLSQNRFDQLCKEGNSFVRNVNRDAVTV
ncbi:MAG: nucleotidyltransferase domain-containing protein [Phycisphaerales bacterium]|nr:MAG: nucleotidyltransferase domain-containing protein [Phycisphaerales bacterium]